MWLESQCVDGIRYCGSVGLWESKGAQMDEGKPARVSTFSPVGAQML